MKEEYKFLLDTEDDEQPEDEDEQPEDEENKDEDEE